MTLFDKEHNQRVLEYLHSQGIEITLDELIIEREAAFATIRQELQERDLEVPDSDEELFHLMRAAMTETRGKNDG